MPALDNRAAGFNREAHVKKLLALVEHLVQHHAGPLYCKVLVLALVGTDPGGVEPDCQDSGKLNIGQLGPRVLGRLGNGMVSRRLPWAKLLGSLVLFCLLLARLLLRPLCRSKNAGDLARKEPWS